MLTSKEIRSKLCCSPNNCTNNCNSCQKPAETIYVNKQYRCISAINITIMMQEFIFIAQLKVGYQKTSNHRRVVSIAQVVQSSFLIVAISTIPERIQFAQ